MTDRLHIQDLTVVPVGHYIITHRNGENLSLFYHNRPFRNVVGNNFVRAVVFELENLWTQIEHLESAAATAHQLEDIQAVLEYAVTVIGSPKRRGIFLQAWHEGLPWAVDNFNTWLEDKSHGA